jgi:CheY-like chemotaxis protein
MRIASFSGKDLLSRFPTGFSGRQSQAPHQIRGKPEAGVARFFLLRPGLPTDIQSGGGEGDRLMRIGTRNESGTSAERVLIVDDDPDMRELLFDLLTADGYESEHVPDGAKALIRLRTHAYCVILLDQNMPGLSGLDLLPSLRTLCPQTTVIMMTAFGDAEMYRAAIERGAFDLLLKPLSIPLLLRTVRSATHFARTLHPRLTGASV